METVLKDDVHMPYAIGLMKVSPGTSPLSLNRIETFFSEDYTLILDSFDARSTKLVNDFLSAIMRYGKKENSVKTIFFHNFSRFDGIILLRHFICHKNKEFVLKPLMRDNRLYEIKVYKSTMKKNKKQRRRLLFRFRDSLLILPKSLNELAQSMCPELGSKGTIDHLTVRLDTLNPMKTSLLDYMKQDILLLAGIMRKAQDIYWNAYHIDIESTMTISSLALSIFRRSYYDPKAFPIHIPTHNEENFIRRGFYGGRSDVFKPYGENLYPYDVNSQYPFIMASNPMAGGIQKWEGQLQDRALEELFGFVEAIIECPKTIHKPFLPFRTEDNLLIFPTGEWAGVYYSEELKYAKSMGYTVIPLRGYLFTKIESPFSSFVSSLYQKRKEAKMAGNESMSFLYKNLLNNLYGRFGIHPNKTITEIGGEDRYNELLKEDNLSSAEFFNNDNEEETYLISYSNNPDSKENLHSWVPPRIAAIQLPASITACARMYMYQFISRDDCFYTDTDSVVLQNPLPDEFVSATELGKLKLESKSASGIFLSAKSYKLTPYDKNQESVRKHKGVAKQLVTDDWYELQYRDPKRTEAKVVPNHFRIDWDQFRILSKDENIKLGIQIDNKRTPVYDKTGLWVDTEPLHISMLSYEDRLLMDNIK